MQKLNEFLAQHGLKVIIVLLALTYAKSCSVDSELTKVKKHLAVIDSLPTRNDLVAKGITYPSRQLDMSIYLSDTAQTPAAAYGIQSVPTLTANIYNKLRDLMTEIMAGKITAKQAIQTQIQWIDTQLATLKK